MKNEDLRKFFPKIYHTVLQPSKVKVKYTAGACVTTSSWLNTVPGMLARNEPGPVPHVWWHWRGPY